MKFAMGILLLTLCPSLPAAAQIPLNGCGCRMSSSTASCNCATGVNKETGRAINEPTVCDGRRGIIGDIITLSPGGLLTRGMPDEDDLIVGEGDGSLANEAKSPAFSIPVTAGSVLFMPVDEPYKLRNVGKQDLRIIVIRMLKTPSESH
jgi:hypothetical protein